MRSDLQKIELLLFRILHELQHSNDYSPAFDSRCERCWDERANNNDF